MKFEVDSWNINKGIQIINLIENALNKFSKKIFNKLIEIPEIAYLVQHFINNSNESLESMKEYEECYKILDDKSKSVVEKYSQTHSIAGAAVAILPKDGSLRAKCKEEFYISEPFFKSPVNK